MSTIGSTGSSEITATPASTAAGEAATSGSVIDDTTVRVVYSSDAEGKPVDNAGDGADRNGLTYPDFDIDLRAVMQTLAAKQSETTEENAEFTSDQIEFMLKDCSDEAAKNVDKSAKQRRKAKQAKFWGDVAKYAGYAGAGLTLILAVATANPMLAIAGIAMIATMSMNESGATEDLVNAVGGGNTLLGTIVVGAAIAAISLASGGVAGLTLFTTMAPALLCTAENLENMGVSSEAAVWIAVGVGIGFGLVGGFAMSRMGSTAVSAGSKSTGAVDDAAGMGDDAARMSDDAAGTTDDAARMSDDAGDASNSASAASRSSSKTTNSLAKAAEESAETVEQVSDFATSLKTVMRKMGEGRLERLLQSKMTKVLESTDDMGKAAALMKTAIHINRAAAGTQAVLDMVVTAAQVAVAVYSKSADTLEAKAGLADARSQFASNQASIYEQRLSDVSESFNTRLSNTCDALDTYHGATRGHMGYTI